MKFVHDRKKAHSDDRLHKNTRKFIRGFTLIELLVVIAIIALLSSVILASLKNVRVKARDARRYADIDQMNNAIQLYISDHSMAPLYGDPTYGSIPVEDNLPASWAAFASSIKPYLNPLPKDPCGLKCPGAVPGSPYFAYAYEAPLSACYGYGTSQGLCLKLGKEAYRVYAEHLERDLSSYGYNTNFGSQ